MEAVQPKAVYFMIGGEGLPAVTFVKSLSPRWHKVTMPAVFRLFRQLTGKPAFQRNRLRGAQWNLFVWPTNEEMDEATFLHYATKYDAWEITPDGRHKRVGPSHTLV